MDITYIETQTFEQMLTKVELLLDRFNRLASPHKGKELEKWLDYQDVCSILQISPRTLQTLRSSGRLIYSQIGGKIYYNKDEVVKLVGDRQVGKQLSLNFEE